MRTANFRDDLLYAVADELSVSHDPDLTVNFTIQWTGLANKYVREGYDLWPFPDLTRTEERAYRRIWKDTKQFVRANSLTGLPDELFYIPTFSYYRVLPGAVSDPPAGTPPTNTSFFEPITLTDTYIELDQECRRGISEILGVWPTDPRHTTGPAAPGMPFCPSERGIEMPAFGGLTTWINYVTRPPKFNATPYDAAKTYAAGEVVYYLVTGECYRARTATVGNAPTITTYWRKVDLPEVLTPFLVNRIAAQVCDDAQTKITLLAEAEEAWHREVDKLMRQGQIYRYHRPKSAGGRRVPLGVSGFWWSVSAPWSGSEVSTLTDVCEEEGDGSPIMQSVTGQDVAYIDSLRGLATSLDHYDTKYLGTLSKVRIVIAAPDPAESSWRLQLGTADATIPEDQVSALNSDPAAPARYWQKVGGY